MDQLVSILSGLVLGYFLWQAVKILYTIWDNTQESVEFDQKFREHLEHIIHIVKQEQQDDMYYWYDNDDDTFLAQGRTWEDIVTVLKQRFPEHIFVLNNTEMIMGPEFEIVQFEVKRQA